MLSLKEVKLIAAQLCDSLIPDNCILLSYLLSLTDISSIHYTSTCALYSSYVISFLYPLRLAPNFMLLLFKYICVVVGIYYEYET